MSPRRTTEIVLVRHAETLDGDDVLVGGQSNPPLSPHGLEQAARIAARLASESIEGVFVTPLRRTVQTAQPLADAREHVPQVVPSLREVQLGDLERQFASTQLRRAAMREVLRRQRWEIGAGAEPASAFGARVAEGLAAVADAVPRGSRAVAFVHGGVIAEACRQATGSRPLAFLRHLRHASITRLHYGHHGMTLDVFNDAAHLSDRHPWR